VNPRCPICDGPTKPMPKHPEAELHRCTGCSHAFSLPSSIDTPEVYGNSYYEADHKRWFEHPNVKLFSRILEYIPLGASVLDVGCGKGDFLRFAAHARPDLSLTGIDLSDNQPEEGIRFVRGEVLTWKTDERFSAIVSLAVIEHVDQVTEFARRLRQLAAPGAVIAVMTINDSSVLYSVARAGRHLGFRLTFDRLYSKHHLHHFTPGSLRRVLEGASLKIDTQFSHAAPIEAMDIPVSSRAADLTLRAGLAAIWLTGALTRRGYLQTAVLRAE
jgi:2-polyprenyl-3-methyl-5-hydroxy-6-metoxy-1,4-benzoquinol methylase